MEFPDLGAHCSHASCNRLDFLPMKCDSCKKSFCNDHFRYEYHGCDGAHKKDVQVPTCPLCNAPVPGKRGEAPDVAVSAHIDEDCQADRAKTRRNKIFTNRCSVKGCRGKEMVPVICTECSLNFCFKHRHSTDHQCEGKSNAIRRKATEAAMNRMNARDAAAPNRNIPNAVQSNAAFKDVQGNMSEDEALARALALSMQEEDNERVRRNANMNRQHVGGESNNGRCIVS